MARPYFMVWGKRKEATRYVVRFRSYDWHEKDRFLRSAIPRPERFIILSTGMATVARSARDLMAPARDHNRALVVIVEHQGEVIAAINNTLRCGQMAYVASVFAALSLAPHERLIGCGIAIGDSG